MWITTITLINSVVYKLNNHRVKHFGSCSEAAWKLGMKERVIHKNRKSRVIHNSVSSFLDNSSA